MREHTLTRFDSKSGDGTFGRFERWVTVEEDDKGNRKRVSSIPTGRYVCKRSMYHKGGYPTFEITGVPDRSRILFHVANTEEDVEGCVGVGMRLGVLKKLDEDTGSIRHKIAVLQSRDAFKEFMAFFEGVDFWTLNVVDYLSP